MRSDKSNFTLIRFLKQIVPRKNLVSFGQHTTRKMAAVHREAIQKQIQQDWANREYIDVITGSIKKITDFLNSFDMSCRSRLAVLNEKLTTLERRIEYLEARVTKGETLT